MSMLYFIIIIIIMDVKKHINMCLFMSMLVGKERGWNSYKDIKK
jgi:hypothetical protein